MRILGGGGRTPRTPPLNPPLTITLTPIQILWHEKQKWFALLVFIVLNLFTFLSPWHPFLLKIFQPLFFGRVRIAHLFSFLSCVVFRFVCFRPVFNIPGLSSWIPLRFSLTFCKVVHRARYGWRWVFIIFCHFQYFCQLYYDYQTYFAGKPRQSLDRYQT